MKTVGFIFFGGGGWKMLSHSAKSSKVNYNRLSHNFPFLFFSPAQVMQRFEEFPSETKRQMPTKDRCTLTKRFYLFPGR